MYFIKKETSATFEEKKSKFIAYLTPINEFDSLMKRLRKEHPKARHYVYAYRHLNEFEQVVENCSDDGEPKGTSGKPSLNVLAGNGLINSAVIIVRYFGGIKLGTGGLVRAYSDAVNLVIENSTLFSYEKLENYMIELEYSSLSKIEYLLKNLDIKIVNKEFNNNVIINIQISSEQHEKLVNQLPREIVLKNNK